MEEKKDLEARVKELEKRLAILEEENKIIPEMQERIDYLEEQLFLKDLLLFGPKSEKKTAEDKKESVHFNEAEADLDTVKEKKPERKKRGKSLTNKLSDNLPSEDVIYDIPDEEKVCSCGGKLEEISRTKTKRLSIIPAQIKVINEYRITRACKNCDGIDYEYSNKPAIKTAVGKKHLIPGGIATASLIAWSISEKFEYALPFYRQEKRFRYIGAEISRSNLCNWAQKAAEACKPLITLIEENIKSSEVVNADETPVQVLKEKGRKPQNKSYMWVFKGGPQKQKAVLFKYSKTRSSEVPLEFFKDYFGWIQTDDWGAYHTALASINKERDDDEKIKHTLCWAHARRKFEKAFKATGSKHADDVLKIIKEIFELEDLRENFSPRGFKKQRKNRASDIFDRLEKYLESISPEVLPQSLLGGAIKYTLSNWDQLINYVEHPELTPSNNGAENAIRPFVVGRKNWLFSDTPRGAESSATLYSIVETAKLNNLNVLHYLNYIFEKLPYAENLEDYEALMPWKLSEEIIKPEDSP